MAALAELLLSRPSTRLRWRRVYRGWRSPRAKNVALASLFFNLARARPGRLRDKPDRD
jgi:hypothetical protein